MAVTRRRFVQGASAVGAAAVGYQFLFGGSDAIVHAAPGADQPSAAKQDTFPTACWIGKQDCGMLARRVDGRVIKFDGIADNPRNQGKLCPKGQAQIMAIYDPNRIQKPLIRTNPKGQTGQWKQASWDEALKLTAERLGEVRTKNPKAILWQKGRSKQEQVYDDAVTKTLGCEKLGHGAYCSDAGYRAAEYITGVHGVLNPDFRYTDFVLSWGWNITNAGGNKTCYITWNQQMTEARERGLKIVQIDPRLRPAGPYADNWLAVRPGTDLALALAFCNVLVEGGFIDAAYLKNHTNAASLVGADGLFVRSGDAEQVWDIAKGAVVAQGTAGDPALDGTYEVNGVSTKPAFQVFRDYIADKTPQWAAKICGVSATEIHQVATEFGNHSQIGNVKVIDGKTVPLRPASIMAYHLSQQELGFSLLRAITTIAMLTGSLGAVGGTLIDTEWKLYKEGEAFAKFEHLKVGSPPYGFLVKDSKYFPINTGNPGIGAISMADPAKFEVDPAKNPEAIIWHMVNPLCSFASRKQFLEGYKTVKFAVMLTPWLNETADYFADVVLPAATIEKYEGPLKASDGYIAAETVRMPPMEPLFESKGDVDIYIDLFEAMGLLTGEKGYIKAVNDALKLTAPAALSTTTKPTGRDVVNAWALQSGLEGGVDYFVTHPTKIKGPIKADKKYGYVTTPPFGGVRHRFYGESLLAAQNEQKAKGVGVQWWQDYTALPTWREPTMFQSPKKYDLTLISYKLVEHKQSRTSWIPLLAELVPEQRLDINPKTAAARGIADGDTIVVESQNAVTGETRQVTTKAAFTEAIRPDVVGMPHHFGLWTMPWTKGQGPTANEIFYTGQGYVACTADQSFQVRVRVFPEGSES